MQKSPQLFLLDGLGSVPLIGDIRDNHPGILCIYTVYGIL
jgi:hypothetical protein